MKLKTLLLILSTTFIVTLYGCDQKSETSELEKIIEQYANLENATIETRIEMHHDAFIDSYESIQKSDGNQVYNRVYHQYMGGSQENVIYMIFHENTFDYWIYNDDLLINTGKDEPLENDQVNTDQSGMFLFNIVDVARLNLEWFVYDTDHYSIDSDYQDAFLAYIFKDIEEFNIDEVIALTVKLTETSYFFELKAIDAFVETTLIMHIYDLNETIVEIPPYPGETE